MGPRLRYVMVMTGVQVRHEPLRHRFVSDVYGGVAELAYLGPRMGAVTFVHTLVPQESRGAGVADALARAGLDWAQAGGYRVRPLCPFVAAYLRRHPEYAAVVDAADT
jgi:uncharacterized protein